uniref:Uncharacterized protein n=1 Tax=Megaselia scalaris TaxID=36166 RepID=T1GJR1_MEGSC
NPNNNDDEYVDIFQVQQLLLDSSSSSHSIPKPKVNLQKAIEYSTHRLQNFNSRKGHDYNSYIYGNYIPTTTSDELYGLWISPNGSS